MVIRRKFKYFATIFWHWIATWLLGVQRKRYRIYDYTDAIAGQDYILDLLFNGEQAYLTAQGDEPQLGDRIWLHLEGQTVKYRVVEADSYGDAAGTWMVFLLRE